MNDIQKRIQEHLRRLRVEAKESLDVQIHTEGMPAFFLVTDLPVKRFEEEDDLFRWIITPWEMKLMVLRTPYNHNRWTAKVSHGYTTPEELDEIVRNIRGHQKSAWEKGEG